MAAARDASAQLDALGVRHALVGGIAVGAHGAPRATRDVDLLVSQAEAFEGTTILSFKAGIPIAVRGVVVDYLTPEGSAHADVLQQALLDASRSEGLPVVALEPLILMKLVAGRRRDLDDVSRLLEPADLQSRVRVYLQSHAPELLERLDMALSE